MIEYQKALEGKICIYKFTSNSMGILNRFSKSKTGKDFTNRQIASDTWNTYHYFFGKNRKLLALISFNENVTNPKNQKEYNQCRRVIFHIDNKNVSVNGILSSEENKKMTQYEDELTSLLEKNKIDCKFVGRMTYCAMKEFIFQVNDVQNFAQTVKRWTNKIKDYKVEIRESSGWEFFNKKVKPNDKYRQQISDRRVIDALIQSGSNPQKTHLLEHIFIGEKSKLEKIKQPLAKMKFTDIQFTEGTLVARKEQRLNLDEIFGVTTVLKSLSIDNDVQYDGWGAKVVK